MPDRWVRFQIRDAYHPTPQSLLDRLHGRDILQGEVVHVVQGWPSAPGPAWPAREKQPEGQDEDFYALRVENIPDLVLVPARVVQHGPRSRP